MKKLDVITVGAATRDVFLQSAAIKIVRDDQFSTGEAECFALGSKIEVDNIVFETGGGATNSAVSFARQGLQAAFVGRIGATDGRGREILQELADEGVGTDLVIRDRRRATAYSVILLTSGGERTVLVYRGASADFRPTDFPATNMKAKWLYVSSISGQLSVLRALWRQAKAHGLMIAWNPGAKELALGLTTLRPLLQQSAVLSLNQEEATELFGLSRFQDEEAFRQLRELVGGLTLVTLGSDGALAGNKHEAWRAGTHPISVVDTTGAGDAFTSGFVGTYLKTGRVVTALQFATANSESVIRSIGAKSGLLRWRQFHKPVTVQHLP